MSKSGGAVQNVIPPTQGGPQEHTSPPLGIWGGQRGYSQINNNLLLVEGVAVLIGWVVEGAFLTGWVAEVATLTAVTHAIIQSLNMA
ncbi:hypothetical protein FH972_019827 [Carpinus fangiana]|uniref:Uncharacterized protein n=1 Tax=Carpinus fangiana TaxID=176857 RepID=A0A5N6RTK7_9ROSI|nr:hypothetical protein FH972_019827 [Carpinus fangiana]